MTQRIFDVENEKDMQDLWDILPDEAYRVRLEQIECFKTPRTVIDKGDGVWLTSEILAINWHDETEITRPIQEATEQDIGKICYFCDNDGVGTYGKLSSFILEDSPDRKFGSEYGSRWQHARRLTKKEIKELC